MGKHLKTPVSLRLDEAELALLTKLAKRYGGKQAAIVAGLNALSGRNDMTKEELLAEIERRLK